MSEKLPPQSEDPLPINDNPPYRYSKELPGSLGELVVTDPRDPFVWLSRIPNAHPSEKAKQAMWAVYRLDGNFSDGRTGKLRDQEAPTDLFEGLSELDDRYITAYQKYLISIDIEEAVQRRQAASDVPPEPSAPTPSESVHESREDILAAIMRHLDAIEGRQNLSD